MRRKISNPQPGPVLIQSNLKKVPGGMCDVQKHPISLFYKKYFESFCKKTLNFLLCIDNSCGHVNQLIVPS